VTRPIHRDAQPMTLLDTDHDCRPARIVRGADPHAARRVAELIDAAFGRTLAGIILPRGREARVRLIASSLRLEKLYVALAGDDRILGVAIVTGHGPVTRLERHALVDAFGRWGGTWRHAIVRLLMRRRHRYPGATRGLEGFVVAPTCRGRGIGGAMLERIIADARSERARAIELNVGDSNPAMHLYERAGFRVTRSIPVGPIARRLGSRRLVFYELLL
jgi:ribosomal protein S18 acetylase RimI-like enzyme